MSETATLIIHLEGPLQSWGYRSRFKNRDSGLEPSKSGVIGLICCALGRDRSTSPSDLAQLKVHVRVDKPGKLLTDFHTAGGGVFRRNGDYFAPTSSGAKGKNPVITERQYLCDAVFTVAVEGDRNLLQEIADRLQDPVWPVCLGRRSCPPSAPLFEALVKGTARDVLGDGGAPGTRFLWEVDKPGLKSETRNDVPVSWTSRLDRTYSVRFVENSIAVIEQ